VLWGVQAAEDEVAFFERCIVGGVESDDATAKVGAGNGGAGDEEAAEKGDGEDFVVDRVEGGGEDADEDGVGGGGFGSGTEGLRVSFCSRVGVVEVYCHARMVVGRGVIFGVLECIFVVV
jgi:hypothetical protein